MCKQVLSKRLLSLILVFVMTGVCLPAFTSPITAYANPGSVFKGTEWQFDPETFAINKEDPTAYFFPYDSEEKALEGFNLDPSSSGRYKSLDGTWKFDFAVKPADRPGAAPTPANITDGVHGHNYPFSADANDFAFTQTTFNDSGWDDIKVPSSWQVHYEQEQNGNYKFKYDIPSYVNHTPYAWEHRPVIGETWENEKVSMTQNIVAEWQNSDLFHNVNPGKDPFGRTGRNMSLAPTGYNGVGTYRRTFNLADWNANGDSVILNLDGVMSSCYIWVNGHEVGYAEDSFTGKAFDITPYVNWSGENAVTVQVFRWSDASHLENQDMLRLSGIFRSVYLTAKRNVDLYDFEILTTPVTSRNYAGDWNLDIKALLRNYRGNTVNEQSVFLTGKLYDSDGIPVASFGDSTDRNTYTWEARNNRLGKAMRVAEVNRHMTVQNPKLWSAEEPNLYKLVLNLREDLGYDDPGTFTSINIGFREVEIINKDTADNRLLINGTRMLNYGTNYHEFGKGNGQYLDLDTIHEDLQIMKRNNVNAIRTSHYPKPGAFYVLADIYGFYVMDEANLECHNAAHSNQAEWIPSLMDRMSNMIERDKNFPSVVMWSLGNESSGGTNWRAVPQWVRERDSTRPMMVDFSDGTSDIFDVYSTMYTPPADMPGNHASWTAPRVLNEYVYSTGNANGNWDEYIERFDSLPKYIGGYTWDWVDKSIWTPADQQKYPGIWYWGYGGDWGDRWGKYWENLSISGNGIVTADRTEKPAVAQMKHAYRGLVAELKDDSTFSVKNKYLFSNANIYDASWALYENDKIIQQGTFAGGLNVDPAPAGVASVTMTIADFPVPFTPPEPKSGAEYFFAVTFSEKGKPFWAEEEGHVVSFSQMPVSFRQAPPSEKEELPEGDVNMTENAAAIKVEGESFSVSVDKTTGAITEYKFKGRDLLGNMANAYQNEEHFPEANVPLCGPVPNFSRAQVENEKGSGITDPPRWKDTGKTREITSVDAVAEDGVVEITVTGILYKWRNALVGNAAADFPRSYTNWDRAGTYTTVYTVYANGEIKLDNTYAFDEFTSGGNWAHEVGTMMTVKAGLENVTWYGRGPGESYSDRKTGNYVGTYESTVSDRFFEKYLTTQETGNAVDVRWMALTDDDGFGLLVKSNYAKARGTSNGTNVVDKGAVLEMNALHYAPEQLNPIPMLNRASTLSHQHPFELFDRYGGNLDTVLRINFMGNGVGGINGWGAGAPLADYQTTLRNRTIEFGYSFMPMDSLNTDEAMNYYMTGSGLFEVPFVEVTGITGIPKETTVGTALTLTGTVNPNNATNNLILWSVRSDGNTGATINGNILNTTAVGTVQIRATIVNGKAAGTDYTQDFTITVKPVSTPRTSFIVTFDGSGGRIGTAKNAPTTRKVTVGRDSTTNLPQGNIMRRKGYTFTGWFTAKTGGFGLSGTQTPAISSDITYYARWTKVSKPKKVKNLRLANRKSRQLRIRYNRVSGVQGYRITYATNRKFTRRKKTINIGKGSTTSRVVTKLKRGTTYWVKVQAYRVDSMGVKVFGKNSAVRKVLLKR